MMLTTWRQMIAGIAMLVAAALALALWPREKIADGAPKVNLESMVPLVFGDWKLDRTLTPVGIGADARAVLDRLYNQILERTYVNGAGERVMLSIAYGADQRGGIAQVHQPESCYIAQGFHLVGNSVGRLDTGRGVLPVKRLMAVQGMRNEPITYWITVGDRVTLPGLDRKLAQLRYGLTGRVADGMLVRVSTLGRDTTLAYLVQDAFIRDLLAEVSEPDRVRLAGAFGV